MSTFQIQTIDFAKTITDQSKDWEDKVLSLLTRCAVAYIAMSPPHKAVIDEIFQLCREIHALPPEEKEKYRIEYSDGVRGFYAGQDCELQTRAYESFEIGNEVASSGLGEGILFAPNIWPQRGMKETVDRYLQLMLRLSRSMEELLVRLLKLPPEFFVVRSKRPFYQVRLIDYLYSADVVGTLGAHTDYECFTFLVQSCDGLEVMDCDGQWHSVPAEGGRMIWLAGDLTEMISDGAIRSVLHRVRVGGQRRQSCVFFKGLDTDVTLTGRLVPVPSLKVRDHLLGRALENFPHLRRKVERGEISPPPGYGLGNPFKRTKILK